MRRAKSGDVLAYFEANPNATLAEVAKACGCSRSYASEVKRGLKGLQACRTRALEDRSIWITFAAAALTRHSAVAAAGEADRLLDEYDARWGNS